MSGNPPEGAGAGAATAGRAGAAAGRGDEEATCAGVGRSAAAAVGAGAGASCERKIAPTRYGPLALTPSKRNRPSSTDVVPTMRPPAKRKTAAPAGARPSTTDPEGVSVTDSTRAAGAR